MYTLLIYLETFRYFRYLLLFLPLSPLSLLLLLSLSPPLPPPSLSLSPLSLSPPGYGFVDFSEEVHALKALESLQADGVDVQFARVRVT